MTFDQIERHRNQFERRFEKKLEAALNRQGDQIADLIEAEDFPISAFLNRDDLNDTLTSMWSAVIPHFADLSATEIEAMFKATKPSKWMQIVQAFLDREGGLLIKLIDATTLDLVKAVIEKGVLDGLGMREIARNLRKEWPEIARYRAERIARTESVRASNYGSIEAAKEMAAASGLELEKEWMTAPATGSDRDRHALIPGLNGQRRKLEEAFSVDGYPAQYPGDSSLPGKHSINCRCSTAMVPVEPKSWRDERDERIRAEYPTLKKKWGQIQAIDELASMDWVALSARQVRRILYQGSRA